MNRNDLTKNSVFVKQRAAAGIISKNTAALYCAEFVGYIRAI